MRTTCTPPHLLQLHTVDVIHMIHTIHMIDMIDMIQVVTPAGVS